MEPTIQEIVFRPFAVSDVQALLTWAKTSDELLQWTGPHFTFPLDERQLLAYANTQGQHRHVISAATAGEDRVVGHAELEVLPEHELGRIGCVAVAPAMRSQGIARRLLGWLIAFAFEELGLHRLELVVFSFNHPALRCYRNVGFREEGLATHARKASDGYWDLIYMGLLRDWWQHT
jgi:RimJ/RimL family protein N-acetyltransferase